MAIPALAVPILGPKVYNLSFGSTVTAAFSFALLYVNLLTVDKFNAHFEWVSSHWINRNKRSTNRNANNGDHMVSIRLLGRIPEVVSQCTNSGKFPL